MREGRARLMLSFSLSLGGWPLQPRLSRLGSVIRDAKLANRLRRYVRQDQTPHSLHATLTGFTTCHAAGHSYSGGMKALGLGLVLLAAALTPVSAQVTVELTLDQDLFLPAESMPLVVRITNRSGQSLHLGRSEDWLSFSVETHDGVVVPKLGEVPVGEDFVLESSRVVTLRVDLAPYFALNRSGRYSVTATMQLKDWNQSVRSQPKSFDIVESARMWEQAIGVPNSALGTNATPEIRKFILHQANSTKSQLRLYVRLTDASGAKPFRVFPIGPMVSFGRPEPQVDKFSNLHLLYQAGPRSFNYAVINPDGEIITRRTYDYAEKRPRLQPDAEGKVLVTGGVRRPTPQDVPSSTEAKSTESEPKPTPSPGEMMPPEL